MNISKRIILAGLVITSIAVAAQDAGVLLRHKIQADSTDVYKIVGKGKQTISSAMTGEQEINFNTENTYELKYGKVDEQGTAAVSATVTVDKLDMDGPAAAMANQKPAPVTVSGKLDSLNRLTLETPKAGDPMAAMMASMSGGSRSSILVELPEKPVKVGDSWDSVIPKGPMTSDEDQKLTVKLTGEKEFEGTQVWVVSVSGQMKMKVDTSKLAAGDKDGNNPMAQFKMLIKGTADITGEGYIDKASGKTLQLTTKTKTKSTMEMVDMGVSMDMGGAIDSTVKLQKKA